MTGFKVFAVVVVLAGIVCSFANAQGFFGGGFGGSPGGGGFGGGSGGGFGGGPGGGGGFMRGFGAISQELTPQQREQLKAIFMDPTTPKYITKQKIRAFFQRIGGNAASRYFEFHEKMQARKAMMQGMFERRQSMMEPGMQQVMQKIRQIHQNENISFAQERAQIKQVMASAPPEVRAKFQDFRERFRNRMMGGGNGGNGSGMFGGGNGQGFGSFGRFQGFQGQQDGGGFSRF